MQSMQRRGMTALVAVLIAAAGGNCATAIVHPSAEDVHWASARWPDATLSALEQGRALYVSKCAGCHHLYRPGAYAPERWPDVIHRMAERAKVSAEEEVLIARYLSAASARRR
jgi:mono/diheme cytochrome c family protein